MYLHVTQPPKVNMHFETSRKLSDEETIKIIRLKKSSKITVSGDVSKSDNETSNVLKIIIERSVMDATRYNIRKNIQMQILTDKEIRY